MTFDRESKLATAHGHRPCADIDCRIVELRRYRLHPAQREVLVELFEREFIESQEALGMSVMGQFRDLDAADCFVWLRDFPDMQSRAASLASFYGGPVWQRHRDAANATMIDSDDVLLLRPAWPGAGIDMKGRTRATDATRAAAAGLVDASVFPLCTPPTPELMRLCRDVMTPVLEAGGARVLGWYETEPSANTYPRLPVREGVQVLAGFAMFDDTRHFDEFVRGGAWERDVAPALQPWLAAPAQTFRLEPTARSAIRR